MRPQALRLCVHYRTNTKARPTWKCAAAPEGNSWIEISGSWEESFWGTSCEVKQELLRKGVDLVCGRQHKIGIVFKWTTARLTLNGIKLHSDQRARRILEQLLSVWVILEMHTCTCVCIHTDTDFLLCVQGFILSLIQKWAELLPVSLWNLLSCRNLCTLQGEHFQHCHPTLICCQCHNPGSRCAWRQRGQFTAWDKSSTEAFQRIPNPLWFPVPTAALSSPGLVHCKVPL